MNLKNYKIGDIEVPIIYYTTNEKQSCLFGAQGIVNILINEEDELTLPYILEKYEKNIISAYKSMSKKIVERSYEEYNEICAKYFEKYEEILDIKAKEIIQTPFDLMHLAWAYEDSTIMLNSNMIYMQEEVIELTIYHELCHIYTLKNYGKLGHDEDFYNMLYKQFSKEKVKEIMTTKK